MLHAAIARPQKVVALIGIASAVDGLVTQFNQLPVEVSHRQPHCILHIILLFFTYYVGPSFNLAAFFIHTIAVFFSIWSLV